MKYAHVHLPLNFVCLWYKVGPWQKSWSFMLRSSGLGYMKS